MRKNIMLLASILLLTGCGNTNPSNNSEATISTNSSEEVVSTVINSSKEEESVSVSTVAAAAKIYVYGADEITVEFENDKDSYHVGDTLKFTATPSEKYLIDAVYIGKDIVEADENGVYSYVIKLKTVQIRFVTKVNPEFVTPIDVILLGGQSNMEGNTISNGLLTTANGFTNDEINAIKAGYDDIKINFMSYYKGSPSNVNSSGGQFVRTQLGQGNPGKGVANGCFGPEVGIADTLHNEGYDKKVVLIKCGIGATYLAPEANEWMSTTGSDYCYQQFTSMIDDSLDLLKEEGYAPSIKAFCWMQGEADGGNQSYANNYGANLEFFVSQFRNKYYDYCPTGGFKFIDAYISSGSVWKYYQQVNQQKLNFANGHDNATVIDTNAAGLKVNAPGGDQYHYNVHSEFKLGQLFGDEIVKVLKSFEK